MIFDIIEKFTFYLNINHWVIQRCTILLFLSLTYILYVYNFILVLSIFVLCLLYHVFVGVTVLIDDYLHDIFLCFYGKLFFRLFFIFLLKFYLLLVL